MPLYSCYLPDSRMMFNSTPSALIRDIPFKKKRRYARRIVFEFQMDQNHLQAEHVRQRNRYQNHRRRNLIIKKLLTKQVGIIK